MKGFKRKSFQLQETMLNSFNFCNSMENNSKNL